MKRYWNCAKKPGSRRRRCICKAIITTMGVKAFLGIKSVGMVITGLQRENSSQRPWKGMPLRSISLRVAMNMAERI